MHIVSRIAQGRCPRAQDYTELFPAHWEKYSGPLTAQAFNYSIMYTVQLYTYVHALCLYSDVNI